MNEIKLDLGKLEYQILNLAKHDRAFWLKIIDNFKSTYFENHGLSTMFNFMKKYFKEYNKVPTRDVLENEIDVDRDIVDKVFESPDEETKEYIYNKTLTFIHHNMMRDELLKSIDLLEKNKFDEILENVKKVVQFNLDYSLGVSIFDVEGRYADIVRLEEDKTTSGFPSLDGVLKGGFIRKQLYAIGAPAGVGKSLFIANFAANALKHNKNVLIYTLEISEGNYSQRIDSILTNIHNKDLSANVNKIKEKYELLKKLTKKNLYIKEFPTKGATINSLESHLELMRLHENFVPDIIFVDYAGLMKPIPNTGDDYRDMKNIFELLRGLAVEFEIPIVTAAQMNRKSMDDKGGTKELVTGVQISDSLGILQTLDLFMTLSQSKKEKENGTINLWIDKHREGESSKKLGFTVNYNTFLLEELV